MNGTFGVIVPFQEVSPVSSTLTDVILAGMSICK